MKSVIYLFVFLLLSMLCNAQQSILLSSNLNSEISNAQVFKLPITVTCKFKNQSSKTLVLVRVVGDSLFFENNLNQSNENNCLYFDLEYIQFQNNTFHLKNTLAIFSTAIALTCSTLMFYGVYKKETDDKISQLAAIILFPATLVSISLSVVSLASLPPKYSSKKYSLFVK
jgi:hypothetical protein